MTIRQLTGLDAPLYLAFRREMWPTYAAAGDWDTVQAKYLEHPHAALCPGSGLYAAIQGDRILGVMGAYPMPVTYAGALHPGHMLVDWAVLPRAQGSPMAGRLWLSLLELPGRKFASMGSPGSQIPLSRRAVRIPSLSSFAVVRPWSAAFAKLLGLLEYARPMPVRVEALPLPAGVSIVDPETIPAPEPPGGEGQAYVHKGPDFWRAYCGHRVGTGALALRLQTDAHQAHVVLTLLSVGRIGASALRALHLSPPIPAAARRTARLLRRTLRRMNVAVLGGEEADPLIGEFLSAVGWRAKRWPTCWWSIPKPGDLFRSQDVRWWLTAADRDSHWGGVQPSERSHS